jgi:hypothetical protein
MISPFRYPSSPHQRRHGPSGYADHASYRPWLRDEFTYRCVYCLLREQWGRVQGLYAIDHFLPVVHHPDKATDYDNLLYTCATCNSAKGARTVPDPTAVLTYPAVHVERDGTIHTSNTEAARLIELLGLDSPISVEFRRLWIGIIALAAQHDPQLHRRLLAYPDDLPDLARLEPPDGNSRPAGIVSSAFAQRQAGTLPEMY